MSFKQRKHAALGVDLAEYILNNDREVEDYDRHCNENGLDPSLKNHTTHIYGVAREYLGLAPLDTKDNKYNGLTVVK